MKENKNPFSYEKLNFLKLTKTKNSKPAGSSNFYLSFYYSNLKNSLTQRA